MFRPAAALCGSAAVPSTHATWGLVTGSPLGVPGVWALLLVTGLLVMLLTACALRRYVLTLRCVFDSRRHPYASLVSADWPQLTVLVTAHPDPAVNAACLENLMGVDYPPGRLLVVPVDDRTSEPTSERTGDDTDDNASAGTRYPTRDRSREIIDALVDKYPGRIKPFRSSAGPPGKAAALQDATAHVETDFIIVADAGCMPTGVVMRGLVRRLMAPFLDPEVGAVMAHVMPGNVGSGLLARLLGLRRPGMYQTAQQAGISPAQCVGTLSAIRLAALQSVGGWPDDAAAAVADLTYRLQLRGWLTLHHNRSASGKDGGKAGGSEIGSEIGKEIGQESGDEVPQNWAAQARQVWRWAAGGNQALARHGSALLGRSEIGLTARLDGLLQLSAHLMAPLLLLGWALCALLYFNVALEMSAPALVLIAFMGHGAVGRSAGGFETAAALQGSRSRRRLRLLAFNGLGAIASAAAIARVVLQQALPQRFLGRTLLRDAPLPDRAAPPRPGAGPGT